MPLPVVPPRTRVEIVAGRVLRLNPPVSESMVPWGPKAGAWRHTPESGWRDYEPDIRVMALETDTESAASQFLVSRWPERVRRAVRDFSHGQWRLILHANFCGPHYEELLKSHPAMGWLVANRERFRPGEPDFATWAAAQRLTGLRRRRILGALGFPESERTVRLMGRVPAGQLTVEMMRAMRDALASDRAERLWRMGRVNYLVALILARPERAALVSPQFLETVSEWNDPQDMERCLDGLSAARGARYVFDSPDWLMAERLEPAGRAVEDEVDRRKYAVRLPGPPLPETPDIQAIRTQGELTREGATMHHCAASYWQRVLDGDAYFYWMSAPERVTVCVTTGLRGWVLEEVRGVCNQEVKPATLAVIRDWIAGGRGARVGGGSP